MRASPLTKDHDFVVVHGYESYAGPHISRHHYTWADMLSLMTKWAGSRCLNETVSVWRQTRRGCERVA